MAKMRSPNYPAVGLSEAVTMAQKLWGKEKKTPVNAAVAATAIGYKGLSGPSRTALAAMKRFGLLEEDKVGMRVSPLALRILHAAGEDDRLQALREAALKPELFRRLFKSHGQASNDALRSYLITRLNFSETGAKALIDAFRDTIAVAKLNDPEYTPPVTPEDIESMGSAIEINTERPVNQRVQEIFRWPLADGVQVELRLTGGQLTPDKVDDISEYLQAVRKVLKRPTK